MEHNDLHSFFDYNGNEYEHVIFDDYKIKIVDSDEEIEDYNFEDEDEWEIRNSDEIYELYKDIKSMYLNMLEYMDYGNFCNYLKNVLTEMKKKH